MPRNYDKIQEEIALTGFFSEYLPPCFSLNSKVLNYPPSQNCDLIAPHSFSMSRFNGNDSRRTIFIPEIGSYLAAYQYMKEKNIIQELIEFTERSKHSFSPILGEDDSIIRHEQVYCPNQNVRKLSNDYIANIGKKIIFASGAKKVLKLDISNCFASFYVHMIPAIIFGYKAAQKEYENYQNGNLDNERYGIYRQLDEVIRQQNLNRTNGLLPGILTSKIIAEALLTRIDTELEEAGFKFARYVDDYEVFLYDDSEKKTISEFSRILKAYGFSLNSEKTEVVTFPYYIVENFNKILEEKLHKELNASDIIDMFSFFYRIEANGTKGAIRFLLKALEQQNKDVEILDKPLYKAYLLSIMANNDRTLTKACSIFINNKEKYPLSEIDVEIIGQLLENHIAYGHDLEVIWLIYLLEETGNLKKDSLLVERVVNTQNELAHLILLHNDLVNEDQEKAIKLKSESWILVYELFARERSSENEVVGRLNVRKNLKMYQHLKKSGIHFIH